MKLRTSGTTYIPVYILMIAYIVGEGLITNRVSLGFIGYIIGLTGMCIWFKYKNIGLLLVSMSLIPNAISKDIIATVSIVTILIYVGINIAKGDNWYTLTGYKVTEWFVKLAIVSLYISTVITYYRYNRHEIISIIFIVTPVFILISMFSSDIQMVKCFLIIELTTRIVLDLKIISYDSKYLGIIDTVLTIVAIVASYKRSINGRAFK